MPSSKEKILTFLSKEQFISGQELATKSGITRAAVHKVISSLRDDGYIIEAVNNKGYKITSFPDKIDSAKIDNLIQQDGNACQVIAFQSIDSTNLEAKRQTADKELNKVVFVAEEQIAGRGRMGRQFASPKGSGVYFSLVYRPEGGIQNPAFLTSAAAVAVCRTIKKLYGEECKIKWVNDVFFNGKKICGILTEGVTNFETGKIDTAIIGIGINVRNCNFDDELSKVASSVEDIMKSQKKKVEKVSRNQIVASVVSELLKIYEKDSTENVMCEYRNRSMLIGAVVTVNPLAGLEGSIYNAKVLDINDRAELIVELEDKTIKNLASGEVSLRSTNFCVK
mgnify:CR=1 FL=1